MRRPSPRKRLTWYVCCSASVIVRQWRCFGCPVSADGGKSGAETVVLACVRGVVGSKDWYCKRMEQRPSANGKRMRQGHEPGHRVTAEGLNRRTSWNRAVAGRITVLGAPQIVSGRARSHDAHCPFLRGRAQSGLRRSLHCPCQRFRHRTGHRSSAPRTLARLAGFCVDPRKIGGLRLRRFGPLRTLLRKGLTRRGTGELEATAVLPPWGTDEKLEI